MSVFSKVKAKVKDWLTGSSSKSTKQKRANTVSNYGGGGSRSLRSRDDGGYTTKAPIETKEQRQKREAEERKRKQEEVTKKLSKITDAKSAGKTAKSIQTSVSGMERVTRKIGEKATPPKAIDKVDNAARKLENKLNNLDDDYAKSKADYNRVTRNKYNPETGNKAHDAKARQRIKSGEYQSDPRLERRALDSPVTRAIESAGRGFGAAATLGGSEIAAQLSKNRQRTGAEKYYQEHKNKYAEIAGELGGSLAMFYLTGGASQTLLTKAAPKLTAKAAEAATERLATKGLSKALLRKAAEKEAVMKYGVEGATQEVIEKIVRRKAAEATAELGKDVAVDLTTGKVMDATNAWLDSRDENGKFQGLEFVKNMAANDALNTVLAFGTSVVPAFRVGKQVGDALDDIVRPQTVEDAIRPPEVKVSLNRKRKTDLVLPNERPNNQANDIDRAFEEMLDQATTKEDFMELLGMPKEIAEIFAEDKAKRNAAKEVAQNIAPPKNGIPKGNIKPLAENLKANELMPRGRNAEYRSAPRSAKRVDTSIEGLTKNLDELKKQTPQTDRERRALETKMNDVEDRLNRAKWRKEGGADMDAMRKAYKGEYDGFDMSKTTNTYQSDVLEGKKKGRTATIVEMSPDEYIERTYRQIFKKPTENSKNFADVPEISEKIDEYAEAMRNGEKFPLPYLDYVTSNQEGRHRALAAKAAGIDKIPVVIIDDAKNPKAIIEEVAEATKKSWDDFDLASAQDELRQVRNEMRELSDKIKKLGNDWNKLTPEEREVSLGMKNRYSELLDREKEIQNEVAEFRKATPLKETKKVTADEKKLVDDEYSKLRKEIQELEALRKDGKEIDLDELEAKTKRLDELKSKQLQHLNEHGTQPEPRKTRKDKGSKRGEAAPPEPRKYEDIDLSEGLNRQDRKVIRSKMKELEAEYNTLQATDENNPRIDELGAEISNIKRTLRRHVGEPAKKVDIKAVNAEKAADEAAERAKFDKIKADAEQAKAEKAAKAEQAKKAKAEKEAKAEQAKAEKEAKAEKAKAEKEAKNQKKNITDEEREHEKVIRETREKIDEAGKALREASEGEYNVRKSANTAVEFGSTEQDKKYIKELSKIIKDAEDGIANTDSALTYKVLTRADRDALAEEAFVRARKSPDAILKRLQAAVENDDVLDIKDIADMEAVTSLYKELGEKMPKEVEELAGRVQMQALTDKAQGLKGISLYLRENSPSYRKRYIKKDFNKFRELVCNESDWSKISASLDKKHNVKGYLDQEIQKLADLTGKENEAEFRKAYVNLQREVWRNSEPTRWELLNLMRHTFMLGSLKTSDNNIIGNLAQSSMWEVSDKLDAVLESMLSKTKAGKDMRRTTTVSVKDNDLVRFMNQIRSGEVAEKFEELGAKARKYGKEDFGELLENARAEDVGDAMGTSKYGFKADKGWDYQYDSKLKKAGRRLIQAPAKAVGVMLSEPDSWFVERNYRKALARYLDVNGITSAELWKKNADIVKDARAYAKDVALENTYKKNARLVQFLEGVRAKGYRKNAKWSDVIKTIGLDAELPYLKVPYNLIVNNFKYSPVGLMKNAGSAAAAMHRGDVEALNKAVKEMSKGLTGTGLMFAGFMMNCDEQMDDDSWGFIAKAQEHLKEYGIRDNSFKIGNKNYNLANFGIGTVEFLMGAKLAQDMNEIGGVPETLLDYPEAVLSAFGTTFDVVSDMSLMENGLAIFDAISNAGDYEMGLSERLENLSAKIFGDYIGQYVPSPARAVARSITSSDLDTGVKKGKSTTRGQRTLQRNVNNVINSIPVVNEKVLPHKVDRHGNYVNERDTTGKKLKTLGQNLTNPFSPREVNIPEPDKVEMSLVQENGKAYQPKGFDENREYKAKIGQGKHAENIDLTGKEREQAARSYKVSGHDMANNLVYSTRGWFGDSHGERAQEILKNVPEDEEKARAYFYKQPEFQALSDDDKIKFMKALYDSRQGRGRTANHEVFVNIKGGDEGDFRFQNDLHWRQQDKYVDNNLADYGITKGQWADIIEAAQYESHKYTEEGGNKDTINSAYKLKNALLAVEGLTAEQRVAAYQAIRGKRNGYGWYDWDGVSKYSGYRRRGYRRWHRWHRYGGSSAKATVPKPKTIKASKLKRGEALVSKRSSSSAKATLPTLKRVEAKIDLPTAKPRKKS